MNQQPERKEPPSMDERWTAFRNLVVREVLAAEGGNQSHAAKILKVHRNTLSRWKKEAGL
jgi:transcriptional regulator with PAS, ATPase and Fis domain